MFQALIKDWRQKFAAASNGQTDPMFPFGFVQVYSFEIKWIWLKYVEYNAVLNIVFASNDI